MECSDRTKGNGFKLKVGRFRLAIRKSLHNEGGEALEQLPRELWCPISGGAQGQVGWGPGQPQLAGGSPAHGMGWDSMIFKIPSNLKPFYDSVLRTHIQQQWLLRISPLPDMSPHPILAGLCRSKGGTAGGG